MINKTKFAGAIGAFGLSAAILGAGLSPVIAAVRELREAPVAAVGIVPQDTVGTLQTRGNKPITVNGSHMPSGGTILSGASIATPADVSASVSLGALGSMDISSSSLLNVEFSPSRVTVHLASGCAVLTTTPGTIAVIDQGGKELARSDNGGTIDVCIDSNRNPVVNQGAGSGRNVGVIGRSSGQVATGGGIGSLGTAGTVGLIAAGSAAVAAVVIAATDKNDINFNDGGVVVVSPSRPTR
jgi:hypothetical protein